MIAKNDLTSFFKIPNQLLDIVLLYNTQGYKPDSIRIKFERIGETQSNGKNRQILVINETSKNFGNSN